LFLEIVKILGGRVTNMGTFFETKRNELAALKKELASLQEETPKESYLVCLF
jgi:hypothetical protein